MDLRQGYRVLFRHCGRCEGLPWNPLSLYGVADMGKNMALGLGQGWDNEYDRIRRDIEGGMDFGTASVDFASSGLGVASAGMVNGVSAAVQGAGMSGGSITVNLMMPDGTKFASYLLGPLSNYAKANGTPILHPT